MREPKSLKSKAPARPPRVQRHSSALPPQLPLSNYSLSTVCPACASKTYRRACKVHCPKCGFMWDCSEL